MSYIEDHKSHCPYCGELIELMIDNSVEEQSYIEDCSVCCRPIVVQVYSHDSEVSVQLFSEDE